MNKQPSYLQLLSEGTLGEKANEIHTCLESCSLCPRSCEVNRLAGEIGCCGVGEKAWVSSYGPHFGEEAPLVGHYGSGTIFFSGCNLHCVFCQNAEISQHLVGRPVASLDLAVMMLELQGRGCHNINLVSPTHVAAQIAEGIALAARQGLSVPIVYNTGGYDSVETLLKLDGLIDIYMPDMKYSRSSDGLRYSGVPDYPECNRAAVWEMHRQVGDLVLGDDGIATRGLLIRHLVLPNNLAGSERILSFISEEISPNTYLNIMDQYRPAYQASRYRELNRRISRGEYLEVINLARRLGLSRLDSR